MTKSKVIRISEENYKRLLKQKTRKNESIDGIIARLIREQGFTENMLSEKFEEPETINKFAEVIAGRLKEQYKFVAK